MTDLKVELLRILTSQLLTPVFQPIVSVNHKKIIGYEALIRGPADSPLHSPLNLFDTAEPTPKAFILRVPVRNR